MLCRLLLAAVLAGLSSHAEAQHAQGQRIATPGQVVVTPVYTGVGVPKCWATAVTATSASVKCVVETVALATVLGINIGSVTNSAPSGLQVGVIALPPS